MRSEFADKYNLVTIQCDYFGFEFMQEAPGIMYHPDKNQLSEIFLPNELREIYKDDNFNLKTFMALAANNNITVNLKADLSGESENNFNDMGLLQAIDNIVAVLNVLSILYGSGKCFNTKKIIIYGHSHGAYLAYLCNAFAPKLFSLIIDNSAWLCPVYLSSNRLFFGNYGKTNIVIFFDYLAKKLVNDSQILELEFLYSKFQNSCNIISYHGTTDNLIKYEAKSAFCKKVSNCYLQKISQNKVDNVVFKSTNHGLDADFKKLFEASLSKRIISFDKGTELELDDEVIFMTDKYKYLIG